MIQILDIVSKYWEVLLFLASLLFHAIWTYWTVRSHEDRIKCLEDKADDTNDVISSLKAIISSMDAKLDILIEGYRTRNK